MNTLISYSHPHFPTPTTWTQPKKTLIITTPKSTSQTPKPTKQSSSSKPAHIPNATAKGFSSAAPSSKKTTISENDIINKNDGDSNSNAEDLPQVVFERMMARIVVSVGIPLAAGLAALKFFGEVKDYWEIPMWVQVMTMLCTFGMSSVGLAYGALSSSWDAEKKGSLLGFEEAQKNWDDMWREEDEYNNSKNNK